MKVNLGCGQDIRTDCVNIDKMPPGDFPDSIYRQGDITNIDWLTKSSSVEQIIAIDCLQYIQSDRLSSTIENWIEKLAIGGVIKILVPDCLLTAKSFYQGQISLEEYSNIVFGFRKNNDVRVSMIDAGTLINLLEKFRIKLTLKRYEGIAIYVEGVKC